MFTQQTLAAFVENLNKCSKISRKSLKRWLQLYNLKCNDIFVPCSNLHLHYVIWWDAHTERAFQKVEKLVTISKSYIIMNFATAIKGYKFSMML